jgi:hypothetical protein
MTLVVELLVRFLGEIMHCYNHSDLTAVGICQYCGKAICHECIELVDTKVACKSTCIEHTKRHNKFLSLSYQSLEKSSGAYKSYGHFSLIAGLLFFIMGILPIGMGKGWGTIFFALLGCVFFYSAASNYKNSKRIKTDEKT